LMGKSGCIHLGEMVINSFTAGLQASSRYIPDWVDEDDYNQRWGMWSAFFKDTCIYFAQPDAMQDLQEIVRKDKKDDKQAASAS